jgi:hypothetical protein
MPRLKTLIFALAVGTAAAAAGPPAAAQVLYTINGQPAPPHIAQSMAQNGLPAGHYWLTPDGYWGVVGQPLPLGNIYASGGGGQRRPSLSERGMLYRPGEILNGR